MFGESFAICECMEWHEVHQSMSQRLSRRLSQALSLGLRSHVFAARHLGPTASAEGARAALCYHSHWSLYEHKATHGEC